MITASDYRQIRILEDTAKLWGFRVSFSRYGDNRLCLLPADNELPIFSRDAELATGTVEELLLFLHGWDRCRMYNKLLGFTDAKLEKAEQNYRNEDLLKTLASGQQSEKSA